MSRAEIVWLDGPVAKARPDGPLRMKEAVYVGAQRLLGEVMRVDADVVTAQIYEDTTGLAPGAELEGSGAPLTVELGPGMLGAIFDGIQRPLTAFAAGGDFVRPGVSAPALDREKTWTFRPACGVGDRLAGGAVLGEVPETTAFMHRVLVPPGISGAVTWIAPEGAYRVTDTIARVQTGNGEGALTMLSRWPIRAARPVKSRLAPRAPLVTGQRVLDSLFPIAKGGTAAMPGGFGTGKTVLEQTLAKWCDADVIVYIGCGERGNEMAGVLEEFPTLEDPRNGRPLLERTVIIANTSNMPVAAREASIYAGVTIAEYFRDQGRHVALFADSISRWAEALRELSGRLAELPAEEGYPAYLATRLAEFFERAGSVTTLAGAEGSLTVVGTVSPPGGDFSEPVTAHARRYVKSFWTLDRFRAQARFYPAIDPLKSDSEYIAQTERWWQDYAGLRWRERRQRLLELMQEQARLEKMVKIVGRDALPAHQRLTLVCAAVFSEAFLRQSAFSPADRYCTPRKQAMMLETLEFFMRRAGEQVAAGADPDRLPELPAVRRLQRMGEDIAGEDAAPFEELTRALDTELAALSGASAKSPAP